MSTQLTGKQISNTYNQLLKVNVSTNTGITSALQTIQSGDATNSALQLSQSRVNIDGTLALNGVDITATASTINAFTTLTDLTGLVAISGGSAYGRTLTAGDGILITNANGASGNPTIAVSLAGIRVSTSSGYFSGDVTVAGSIWAAGGVFSGTVSAATFDGALIGDVTGDIDGADGSFSTKVSATDFVAATGSFTTKVSGVAAEFSGNVSVGASIYAAGGVYTGTVSAAYFAGDGSNLTNVPSAEGGTMKTLVSGTGIAFTVGGVAATTITVSGVIGLAANQTFGTVSLGHVAVTTGLSVPAGSAATFGVPVSGTSAVFSGDVSAANVYAATQIYVGGVAVPDAAAITSINNVTTSINTVVANVSALTSVNLAAITSINTVVANVSSALATSIGNSNTNITTNASAITSINTVVANVSALTTVNAAAITSINTVVANVSALTSVNLAAITSINTVVANVSSALATSIGNSNTNITTNASAITSINTVVATVSSALATSIGNTNTVLAATSAALATSIANYLPLAGGALTGNVSISDAYLELKSTDAGSGTSPSFYIARDSASPAAGDNLGQISWYGRNTDATWMSYGYIRGEIIDQTAGSEDSSFYFLNSAGGSLYYSLKIGSTGAYIRGPVSCGGSLYVDQSGGGIQVNTNTSVGKDLHIAGAAVADLVSLTDGANIAVNFNTGQNFHLTLAGSRTLDNPTNCVAGQTGSIFIAQDGSGLHTLAYGSNWEFIESSIPTIPTSANSVSRLDYIVRTSTAVQSILSKEYG